MNRSIFLLTASLFSVALFAVMPAHAGPTTHPTDGLLPLRFVSSGRLDESQLDKELPLAIVGQLVAPGAEQGVQPLRPAWRPFLDPPNDRFCPLAPTEYDHIIDQLSKGEANIMESSGNEETLVYLIGPKMDGSNDWIVHSLSRHGNSFSIETSQWQADIPRDATPKPSRGAQLINLGKLPAGDYEVHLSVYQYQADANTYPLYKPEGARSASVSFSVSNPEALHMALRPAAAIIEKDLDHAMQPDTTTLYQRPSYLPLSPGQLPMEKTPSPGTIRHEPVVGTFSFENWLATKPEGHAPAPALDKPKPGDRLYAEFYGPDLNMGESMALRDIAWNGDTVTLTADLWRDDGKRLQNMPFTPYLLIPLYVKPNTHPDKLHVVFKTRLLLAPDFGEPHQHDASNDTETKLDLTFEK